MTILVLGASGVTGKHLVKQLLEMDQNVRVMVRSSSTIPADWKNNAQVFVIKASITELSVEEMAAYTKDCQAVVSCLGHNPTFAGIFGKPRRLVADAVALIWAAIERNPPESPVRFVLMNTAGNRNRDLNEPVPAIQKLLMMLIRVILPPQWDNEKAAEFLRSGVGQGNTWMEWVVVRPDSLTDQDMVTEYQVYASPVRSALFNPGKTSRINVGHFMAKLVVDNELWDLWKGQMPVIYSPEKE